MFDIYRNWENATVVTLIVETRTWNVEVHRRDRMCRFGKGWDKFTRQNGFLVGQKLQFTYHDHFSFVVNIHP